MLRHMIQWSVRSVLKFYFLLNVLNVGAQNFDKDNIFVKTLEKCHRNNTAEFDICIKDAANALRPQYRAGIPELKIMPFDPFYIKKVSTSRLNMKLELRNVYERGWTGSKVTKFRSNLPVSTFSYHQHFPEKYLDGDYHFTANLVTPFQNEGRFNLSLYNYTQVTTVRWSKPGQPFKVHVKALDSGDMKLHLTNLLSGRAVIESALDAVINAAWRPGFNLMKPIIDDLVSSAFTKIFNDRLQHVPLREIIPE